MSRTSRLKIYFLFVAVLTAQIFVWAQIKDVRARWMNVPPITTEQVVTAFTLGDAQLAYRTIGLMLQNFGDSGGRVTAFRDYDYERLAAWLHLETELDPVSNYAPFLAAYYFSAVDNPQKISLLADYLHKVGSSTEG